MKSVVLENDYRKKKIFPVDSLPLGFKDPRLFFQALSSFPLIAPLSWPLSFPLCSFVLHSTFPPSPFTYLSRDSWICLYLRVPFFLCVAWWICPDKQKKRNKKWKIRFKNKNTVLSMGIVAGNLKASLRKKAAGLKVVITHQCFRST